MEKAKQMVNLRVLAVKRVRDPGVPNENVPDLSPAAFRHRW
jgi:hypothetical protein